MVLSHFEMLRGAAGDVKELEYISCLHQTDPDEVRQDGSIRGKLPARDGKIAYREEWS